MSSGDKKRASLLQRVDFINEDDSASEEIFVENRTNSLFETAIGHIEDIFMEEEFQSLQDDFLHQYCDIFEDTEENKLEYSDLHQKYTDLLETYIEAELHKRIDNFSMEDLLRELLSRRDQLDGEVFEMLFTFTDFLSFKDLMLDFKKVKHGQMVDLTVAVTGVSNTKDVHMTSQSSEFDQ